MDELKRKFHNPTPGWVGAVVLDDDNKPKGMPVEPGGSIWLSKAEERLTAEAPRLAEDNPFTKGWREVTAIGPSGEPTEWVDREGVLVLSEEPARSILSDRFTPSTAADAAAAEPPPAPEPEKDAAEGEREPEVPEHTGAPPLPQQPPVVGKPAPDEHVATPEAVRANDDHLAARAEREAEIHALEPAQLAELIGEAAEGSQDLLLARAELADRQRSIEEHTAEERESAPQGAEAIGVQQRPEALV